MKKLLTISGLLLGAAVAVLVITPASSQAQSSTERLVVYGDTVFFYGQGKPGNCFNSNRFKRGEPVGFRMTAINPATGKRDRSTQLVVHVTYGGKTIDLPMRDRQNERQPEREFWVAEWVVPADAPVGAVRYTVTAKDAQGRSGEFKPFDVAASQLTIVE